MLGSQALDHGGSDYPEFINKKLGESWVDVSGTAWSPGGIYQAEEGWPGTSLSAHLAMLLPEPGLPFSP